MYYAESKKDAQVNCKGGGQREKFDRPSVRPLVCSSFRTFVWLIALLTLTRQTFGHTKFSKGNNNN